jgi:thymidine kinase
LRYGTLTLVCGPMYAGKTTETLKRVLWARNGRNQKVRVLKPAYDTRYAEVEIVSHDGLRTAAESVSNLPEIGSTADVVVLDEVQFFMDPYVSGDVPEWVLGLLREGIDVIAAGLDMDWRGRPFAVTASLSAMADEIVKLAANCTVCGRPARKTWKREKSGGSVELGGTDKYEARCNDHWLLADRSDH